MNAQKNTPYVKQYKGSLLVNPITKHNPYLHNFPTTSDVKRRVKAMDSSNKKEDVNPDAKLYLNLLKRRNHLKNKGVRTMILTSKSGKLMSYKKWQEEKQRKAIKNI